MSLPGGAAAGAATPAGKRAEPGEGRRRGKGRGGGGDAKWRWRPGGAGSWVAGWPGGRIDRTEAAGGRVGADNAPSNNLLPCDITCYAANRECREIAGQISRRLAGRIEREKKDRGENAQGGTFALAVLPRPPWETFRVPRIVGVTSRL